MKKFPVILILASLILTRAAAQIVTVEVKLDQDQFLPGESLPVTVRVLNNSGQTLKLGANPNWLKFSIVYADNGAAVINNSEPPVVEPFTLGSSEIATKRLDIAPYFRLKHAGRYHLVATVHIDEWNSDVVSPPKDFDIIDGAEIWSQDFGVPTTVTNRPPEVRKYILEEANYLRKQLRLYVLVSNQSRTAFYKVTAVGPMVSFSQPEEQLDRMSNLHVLYQSGAQSFIYSVINPDGTITQQDIYDLVNTRPHLSMNSAGDIVVVGGVRRPKPGELPTVNAPDELPAPAKQ